MTKPNCLIGKADAFASELFDHIREMSKDTLGVSRQGYSDLETEVHNYLSDVAAKLGMERRTDPAGNTWLRYPGKNPSLPAIVSGSHADSVPKGGNFDGLAGVVAALTVAWWMHEIGFTPERNYEVWIIRNEESSFFGKAYVGSLGVTGQLTEGDLALKHRDLDLTLGEAIRAQGFDTAPLTAGKPLVDLKQIATFFELHIEQGPTLDSGKNRVGVVTGIRGNYRHKCVRCIGQTAHSGAVDKQFRHDAVMAFIELGHRMDQHWDEWLKEGKDLVFTFGVAKTGPTAAIAIIPGEIDFSVDMRSLSQETLDGFHDLLVKEAEAVGRERGVKFEFDRRMLCDPLAIPPNLVDKLDHLAKKYELPYQRIPSGAGHDSVVFGTKGVPVAMIFVANQKGSHNPYEEMRIDDFILGTELLWRAVENFEE